MSDTTVKRCLFAFLLLGIATLYTALLFDHAPPRCRNGSIEANFTDCGRR